MTAFLPAIICLSIAAPVPPEAIAEQKLEAALIAAIHYFAELGDADHLQAVLDKYPKLVNEQRRFPQPRKPYSTDAFTPLHWTASKGRTEAARVLLQYKANPNAVSGRGWTPLHIAAQAGNLDVVKLLVENGAKVEAKTEAQAEHSAIPPSSPPGAKPILYPAIPAMTALDVAIESKKPDVVTYLKSLPK